MKKTPLIIFLFIYFASYAQNLVLNPDFELYRCAPWLNSSIEDCNSWTNPTLASPDYFNNNCIEEKTVAIPQKYWGFQMPKSGNSYAGIIAYDNRKHNPQEAGAEYLQGSLSETMQANKTYNVEFSVSLAECSKISLQHLGIFFSEKEIKEKTVGLLKFIPQVISHTDISDTSKWVTIKETYLAKGNEKYFIIGCFDDGQKIKFDKVKPSKSIPDPRDYAYYFIDDMIITSPTGVRQQ